MRFLIFLAVVLGLSGLGALGLDRPWLGLVLFGCAASLVLLGLLFPVDDEVFPIDDGPQMR